MESRNHWLTEWTPQERAYRSAEANRRAWDGELLNCSDYYRKSKIVDGRPVSIRNHAGIDREVKHTHGDFHGECSSQLRVDETFQQWCSERLPKSPPKRLSLAARMRQAERQRVAEEKVKATLRHRVEARQAAELRLFPTPPPGSRLARVKREEHEKILEAIRPDSDGMDVDGTGIAREVPYERWKRQFGHGKALTERLTGRYVASMGDVGRLERTPAGWKLPGKERLTTTKADDFFASSLRGYEPSTPSSSSPRLRQSARSMRRQTLRSGGGGRSEIRI